MKVAIAGAGKLGTTIAEAFFNSGHEVTLLDSNDERSQNVGKILDIYTVTADAKQIEVLKDLRIGEYDLLVAATNNDELNIIVGSFAKKLGCKTVIARVRTPEHMTQIDFIKETMGIDYIVNPDKACAEEIFKYIVQEYALSGGKLSKNGIGVLEIESDSIKGLAGSAVKECGQFLKNILIAAISRQGRIIIPNGSTVILPGDIVYIIGLQSDIDKIQAGVKQDKQDKRLSRVMIAGGGNSSFFLAKKLIDNGIHVKILEKNRKRCEYLSAELSKALILNADASDIKFLKEENLQGMDAFISLTGLDEQNILLSMVAKQNGVQKIAAKTSHNSYDNITNELGNIMTINPLDITATDILHYVRKEGVVLFSQVINGQAEFREIMVEKTMPITDKTLFEITIPEGILFAALDRNGDISIPKGSTRIQAGDKILILSLLSASGELESLLTKSVSHSL